MAAVDATNEIERISGGEVAVSINPTIPSGDHSVWADVSPLFELACRDNSSGDFDGIVASIGDVDITPEKIRLFLPKVNWDYLASMYVPGRSGAECQARWLNCEDPLINQNPWTSMEDKVLLFLTRGLGRY